MVGGTLQKPDSSTSSSQDESASYSVRAADRTRSILDTIFTHRMGDGFASRLWDGTFWPAAPSR